MKVRQARPLNVIQLLALDSIALANGGARAASLVPPQAPASSPVFHDGTVGLSEQLFGALKRDGRLKAWLRWVFARLGDPGSITVNSMEL
jgi:hypothetical protein